MITFKCPQCDAPMTVPSCQAGQTETCPSCNHPAVVPPEAPTEAEMEDLAKKLHHPEIKVRCQAAETLGGSDSLKAMELLVEAFRDSDKFVRMKATESLRQIGDPRAVGMLVRDLGGHWISQTIVQEAVRELVKFGPPAGEPLIEILTEANKNPRKYEPDAIKASIMILARLGEEKALTLIAKMFRRHYDIHVRDEAACALAMIDRPEMWPKIAKLPESSRRSPARQLAKEIIKEKHILI